MATTMKSTVKVEVSGAGTSSATHSIEVEAFDKIEVTVPGATGGTPGEIDVEVQPGGTGQVQLLFITADSYSEDLTYSVTGGTSDVVLDAPQLMAGAGAVALLGTAQNTFTFSNADSSAVGVQILVGRDATP